MTKSPINKIMEIVGAADENDAVAKVESLSTEVASLERVINGLSVTSVVMTNGRPLFVQLPPNSKPEDYDPAFLEVVRDTLIDASSMMRWSIGASKEKAIGNGV
jgi:hypothetical protein